MTEQTNVATRSRHARNVDHGVMLLDAQLGRDVWLPRVDLDTLDVASSDRCVACQATRTSWFGDAIRALGFDELSTAFDKGGVRVNFTESHGFGISWSGVPSESRDFAGLTATWVQRIRQLRGEEVTP